MAASMYRSCLMSSRNFRINVRQFNSIATKSAGLNTKRLFIGVPCACVLLWEARRQLRLYYGFSPALQAREPESEKKDTAAPPSHTYRELRFQQFASVQYEGVIYMTPQDFLESVTEEIPRPRIGRQTLRKPDVDSWLKNTPAKRKGSKALFRSMHNKGLISYTEYLFLLCVLTKPTSGFRIAFNMFDTDGNQIVDKKEFLVDNYALLSPLKTVPKIWKFIASDKLEHFFTLPPHERKFVPRERKQLQALLDLESVFSKQRDSKGMSRRSGNTKEDEEKFYSLYGRPSTGLDHPVQDTTLLIHFFGHRGNDVLKFDDFSRFMENLQSEVIELEFLEFSRGMQTISEEDFARVLLRYTNLDKMEIGECINRVKSRMPEETGISFEEFKKFCQFMNSLDDFTIAMNMYTYAQQPVSQEEFQRAVKICTGFHLGSHIVSTLFNIFDVDGDGHLSYKEFISIMKDRKHRGSRSQHFHQPRSWDAFKACVKNEMKSY